MTVAVLDTGIAYRAQGTHFRRSPDFTAGQFVKGHDFVDDDRLPLDENGHGTHVAGTIAEKTNNGIGLTGLAFRAKLMPVRVLDAQGRGRADEIAKGIRFAVANGADVINMSFNFGCAREGARRRRSAAAGLPPRRDHGCLGWQPRLGGLRLPAGHRPAHDRRRRQHRGRLPGRLLAERPRRRPDRPGRWQPALLGCPSISSGSIYQVTLKAGSTRRFGEPSNYIGTSMSAAHVSGVAAMVLASGTVKRTPTSRAVTSACADSA